MPKFTDHLKGLAKLEDNAGKKVAFHSAAIEIEALQKELDDLKASIPKIKSDAICELLDNLDYSEQGIGCGVEDRGITDRYEAARYGYEECLEKIGFYASQLEGDTE